MRITFVLIAFSVSLSTGFGQSDGLRKLHYNVKNSIAINGYDPVSYFNGKPLEGDPQIKSTYKNITYYFSSPANVEKFQLNPEKYEPAYGGWCAYAMGESAEKVKIDPETFKILDGRLYLFYNFWGSNTLKDWNKNEKKLKASADHNWLNIVR